MSESRTVFVPDGLAGERVDVAVARLLGLSRAKAAELAHEGRVEVDGAVTGKSHRLHGGAMMTVELPPPPGQPTAAEAVPGMTIVYDDDDIVVVDKPVGVAAHSSPGWSGPTVVGALAAAGFGIATSGAPERQGIVHRLDVGTSGLMVVAKTDRAYPGLKRAFKRREVTKVYLAAVQGHPDPLVGTIEAPIGRHPSREFKFAVRSGGKASVTHYEVVEAFRGASVVRVHLETGRTHQIRVHFSAIGHPLLGDPTYGANPLLAAELGLDRQWLHAGHLSFTHPVSGDPVEVASPVPEDLAAALDRLREVYS
ncbi:MAG: RluA family pseudouridine synthase [Bifidobacteriaceae bacterium]|jgi:23S rRNA pseudouridine1911/1915/1917 synthase|nr:RluA family pseudouridine synthase [Bifidobacteriaceae bacterium]